MGKEQSCTAVIDGIRAEGRALLETDELLFRGQPRLKVRLADIAKVRVAGDTLVVQHKGGEAIFELGAKQAAAWAQRITAPPALLDKLGIKAETSVLALQVSDQALLANVEAQAASLRRTRRGAKVDVVLLGAEKPDDLAALEGLEFAIHAAGAIWVVYPKGRKDIREADVMGAARQAGWKDTKTCRASETHTALRFVIPVEKRPAAAKKR